MALKHHLGVFNAVSEGSFLWMYMLRPWICYRRRLKLVIVMRENLREVDSLQLMEELFVDVKATKISILWENVDRILEIKLYNFWRRFCGC